MASEPRRWWLEQDVVSGVHKIIDRYPLGKRRYVYSGLTYGGLYQDTYTIQEDDPLSAQVEFDPGI